MPSSNRGSEADPEERTGGRGVGVDMRLPMLSLVVDMTEVDSDDDTGQVEARVFGQMDTDDDDSAIDEDVRRTGMSVALVSRHRLTRQTRSFLALEVLLLVASCCVLKGVLL